MDSSPPPPSLEAIRSARSRLGERVHTTPVWLWRDDRLTERLGHDARVHLKLEVWQRGGSFKIRAALLRALSLDRAALDRGLTAVSAGNHAIAVSHAARIVGSTAKVVMPRTADPFRVERCRELGAEVVIVEDVHQAFTTVRRIETDEGRTFLHPFEGETVALGTAGVGLELIEQSPDLDAVIVPIGGGGLCAGVASAVKQLRPGCKVYGVEPEGADTMSRSLRAGKPVGIERVRTIADSLGAPHSEPYSFALCRRFLDDLVLVSDDELRGAMKLLFEEIHLAVEPAGAAATAAALGPLRDRLRGTRVGLILCGTNISASRFFDSLRARGPEEPPARAEVKAPKT